MALKMSAEELQIARVEGTGPWGADSWKFAQEHFTEDELYEVRDLSKAVSMMKVDKDVVEELRDALASHQDKHGHFPSCDLKGMEKPVDHPATFLRFTGVARCERSRNILATTKTATDEETP